MLNEKIKLLRNQRNITQVELARHLSVSKQAVSNWENDNIQPSIDMLVKIAGFFSVSTDYLLGEDVRKYLAGHGEDEKKRNCHGKNGEDIILKVPEGTVIKEAESGKELLLS